MPRAKNRNNLLILLFFMINFRDDCVSAPTDFSCGKVETLAKTWAALRNEEILAVWTRAFL
jgi:hypothetical protein